jgi:hypothetical protein
MCHVGEFNLSHMSLTSVAALTALRELPNTNPTLYHEISRKSDEPTGNAEKDFDKIDDKPMDGSDIPVEVIIAQVVDNSLVGVQGFKVSDKGSVVRIGVAEETEVVLANETANETVGGDVTLSRGHRTKVVNTKYNGAMWEQH